MGYRGTQQGNSNRLLFSNRARFRREWATFIPSIWVLILHSFEAQSALQPENTKPLRLTSHVRGAAPYAQRGGASASFLSLGTSWRCLGTPFTKHRWHIRHQWHPEARSQKKTNEGLMTRPLCPLFFFGGAGGLRSAFFLLAFDFYLQAPRKHETPPTTA